jgi:hypothetical protein
MKMQMKFLFKCTNHVEKTPSLSVDVTADKYYCFSCGSQGTISESPDVTRLVVDYLKNIVSFMEENL